MKKQQDREAWQDYIELLTQLDQDLSGLIYEAETRIINQLNRKVPTDITFDIIPILRGLRAAQKRAQESLSLYRI